MSSPDYREIFSRFSRMNVMVIGDVMVDAYLFGKVDRISPEAPVPVVSVERRLSRLGGAANVALNLRSLGARPLLCSVAGADAKGAEFAELLEKEGIAGSGMVFSKERMTTTKFRVIGNNVQMLRVDEEATHDLSPADTRKLLGIIRGQMESLPVSAVVIQDYDKGVLTPELIHAVIALAREHDIPVCVDPKKRNFLAYAGATLFKPNLNELREGLNREVSPADPASLEAAADYFHRQQGIPYFLATLSEKGAFISTRDHAGETVRHLIPAHVRNIADVSGAGDTVISVAALCLACGLDPLRIASVANLAGGLVCEEVGVVSVNREKLLEEAMTLL